jgi:hypothetical protein
MPGHTAILSPPTEAAHTCKVESVEPRMTLPIACTLGRTAGAERMRRWQSLLATHRTNSRRDATTIEVRFRFDDEANRELHDLVAAERECCAFVEWALVTQGNELVLTVRGDDETLATFSF